MNNFEQKESVLKTLIGHAAFDGFTDAGLKRAAGSSGLSDAEAQRLFPHGPASLVAFFSEWADGEMERRLAGLDLSSLKIRARIKAAVLARIEVLSPFKQAARRAGAFLSLPPHAALGLELVYRSVDAMWRAVGDTSTDFNFYTKRLILSGVYSTTLLHWFNDKSAGAEATEAFLDRRIEDVMRFEAFKGELKKGLSRLPSLSDVLARIDPQSRR